jgi:serine/threonine-protein kinase
MSRDAPDESLLGRTIAGKFAVESYVGGGAMGAVYKARQVALEKVVAIKVMHRDIAKDEKYVHRFKREAKAASKLDHPNSLRVIDFGEDDGVLYIAMEFVDGRDLFHLIKEGWPLREQRIVDIMMQALAALAVAHDHGIVHRDLKPENIMILAGKDDEGAERDIVKVCDFGIAKVSEARNENKTDQRLSTKGLVVGTPEYMSPEQGRGDPLDLRTDIYSMGVILYQLLTRQVPFEAENAIGVVLKHVTEEPRRPSELYPGVNPRLEAIALKAMKKKPEERYQTAREMRSELRSAVDGIAQHTASVALPPARSSSPSRPNPSDSAPNLASAATIPIDANEVVARSDGIVPPKRERSPADETGALPAGVPRRWTGYVLSGLLVVVVLGIGGLVAKRYVVTTTVVPPPPESGTTTPSSPTVTTPTALPSDTPPSSATNHAPTSPSHPLNVVAPPHVSASSKADAGPRASASASASAAHSASSATSAVAPPVVDAGAPANGGASYVRVGAVTKAQGLDANAVRTGIAALHDDLDACFRNGIKAGDAKEPGSLHVRVEVTATSVAANGTAASSTAHTAQCVVGVIQHARIDGVGSAEVDLSLVP